MAVYDEQGHPLDSDATPSWYTPNNGQGPQNGNGWTPPVDLPGIYSGGNPNQMGAYDPNFKYGGGGGNFFRKMLEHMPQYQAGKLLARGGRSLWHAIMNQMGQHGGNNAHAMGKYDPNFNYGGGGGPHNGFGGPGAMAGGAFSGLPEGFTEGNRFGGGAPTFEGPGFTGPSWSPGGSIFGGTLAPGGLVAGGGSFDNGGSAGNMTGSAGDSIGRHLLMQMLRGDPSARASQYSFQKYNQGPFQMEPFGQFNNAWNYYQQNGLPNASALGGKSSMGNIAGAGKPMTKNQ